MEPELSRPLAACFPLAMTTLPHTPAAVKHIRELSGFCCSLRVCVDTLPQWGYSGDMEKLLTPLTIALIMAVLGGHIYRYMFYKGGKRRVPGQHRYNEDCVNTFWARVTPTDAEPYEVPMWGYMKLEMGH